MEKDQNSKKIDEQVLNVVGVILRLPSGKLSQSSEKGQTERWDSLAQLSILSALEQEFSIEIPPDIAVDLTSIKAMVDYIRQTTST